MINCKVPNLRSIPSNKTQIFNTKISKILESNREVVVKVSCSFFVSKRLINDYTGIQTRSGVVAAKI